MRRTVLLALFIAWTMTSATVLAKPGIDQAFIKPSSEKTWGQLFADYFGLGHYQKSYALIVGISEFSGYNDLPTGQDVIRMKDFLVNEAGFDHVHVLTEDQVSQARLSSLMVDEFPGLIDENDRFLLYWSGHGVTRPLKIGARGYLPLAKSEPGKYASMVSMLDIRRWDPLIPATQVLYLIDSCFSGLAGYATQSDDLRDVAIAQLALPSRMLMVAGSEGQQTFAHDELGGGVFTSAVLDGLKGDADSASTIAKDGVVSMRELADYVGKRVEIERRRFNYRKPITPQLRALANNQGQFFFLTTEHKTLQALARGKEPMGQVKDKEPVPMAAGAPSDRPVAKKMLRDFFRSPDIPQNVAPSDRPAGSSGDAVVPGRSISAVEAGKNRLSANSNTSDETRGKSNEYLETKRSEDGLPSNDCANRNPLLSCFFSN